MRNEQNKILNEIKNEEVRLLNLKRMAKSFGFSNEFLSHRVSKKTINDQTNKKKTDFKELNLNFNKSNTVGKWSYHFKTYHLEWSLETCQIFEYPKDYKGTIKEFYLSCIDNHTASRLFETIDIFGDNISEVKVINQIINTPSGLKKILLFSSHPMYNDVGECIGISGLVKDITSKITGKEGLNHFFRMSNDLNCIIHLDTYFVKVSPAWMKVLGYTEQEILSRSFLSFIHPDDVEKTKKALKQLENSKVTNYFENRYITKSGDIVYLSWYSYLNKDTYLLYCSARDVTKSKIARDELLSDLSSKDLLLREIHHRVKNNLQIITSLLSLQAGANAKETHLAELYEDSRSRIQSMAAIHEMFYQSEELDKIEFGKYLTKLIGDLVAEFRHSKLIDLKFDAEEIYVNLDTAIPLGLIINEVVTNSIKHGENLSGEVRIFVSIKQLECNDIQITIGDEGVNGSENTLNQYGDSLGVMLINSLVEQIDGEIEQMEDYDGTVFRLRFKNKLGVKN